MDKVKNKLIIVQPVKTNTVNCFWLNKLLLKIYKYRLEKMQKTSVKDKSHSALVPFFLERNRVEFERENLEIGIIGHPGPNC